MISSPSSNNISLGPYFSYNYEDFLIPASISKYLGSVLRILDYTVASISLDTIAIIKPNIVNNKAIKLESSFIYQFEITKPVIYIN